MSRYFSNAKLNFHWRDDPGSFVETVSGKYEMPENIIFKDNEKILAIDKHGNFEPIKDKFALELFIINHNFYRKSDSLARR